MGVINYEDEIPCSIPPARLFKAFILDGDNFVPKVLPQAFKSFENIEGNGGPGTIKLIHFGEGSHFKTAKHRIDEIDEKNRVFKYTVLEGDVLGDDLESISYIVKIEDGPNGGSIVKSTSKYHCKSDHHNVIEEKIKEGKEKAKAIYKAIEAHLHANPHEYN